MSERLCRLFEQVDRAHDGLAASIVEIVVPFDELIRGYHIRGHRKTMTLNTYDVYNILHSRCGAWT